MGIASGRGNVEQFRTRPLQGAYPYLWLDAKHLKVRDRGRVVSKALVIAYAVHDSGRREVIGLEQNDEWIVCRRYLSEESMRQILCADPLLEDSPSQTQQEVSELPQAA